MENHNKLLAFAGIAGELGFLIAIPIVVFAFLGRWLDRHFETGALFLAIGIILAIAATGILIARRLERMIKRL